LCDHIDDFPSLKLKSLDSGVIYSANVWRKDAHYFYPRTMTSYTDEDSNWCVCDVETVEVVADVTGVTESNKDVVCDAFATAMSGTATYCSLSGRNTHRRRLIVTSATLYMDIAVTDASVAVTTLQEENFIDRVVLPSEVQVQSLTANNVLEETSNSSSVGSRFIHILIHYGVAIFGVLLISVVGSYFYYYVNQEESAKDVESGACCKGLSLRRRMSIITRGF